MAQFRTQYVRKTKLLPSSGLKYRPYAATRTGRQEYELSGFRCGTQHTQQTANSVFWPPERAHRTSTELSCPFKCPSQQYNPATAYICDADFTPDTTGTMLTSDRQVAFAPLYICICMMEYWLFSLLLLRDYTLSLGLLCLFWMVLMC